MTPQSPAFAITSSPNSPEWSIAGRWRVLCNFGRGLKLARSPFFFFVPHGRWGPFLLGLFGGCMALYSMSIYVGRLGPARLSVSHLSA